MLEAIIATVKAVAQQEIMPRYMRVARERKGGRQPLYTSRCNGAGIPVARTNQVIFGPCRGRGNDRGRAKGVLAYGLRWGLVSRPHRNGTSNFVNGLPYFAVSVALMRKGKSVLGVVYNPVADEMFYAEQGKGAYLNGERLPIRTSVPVLRSAIANVDLKRLGGKLAEAICSARPFSSQRNYGSCSLEWCYTAAGRFDLYLGWRTEIVGLCRRLPHSRGSRRANVRFQSG